MKKYAVAIDGPSGAGKSSIAKAVAAQLNIMYVDTGAIYRTVGLFVYRQGIASTDREAIITLLPQIKIELRHIGGVQHIFLDSEDVSDRIRTETISKYASDVSAIPEVRAYLLGLQRDTAKKISVIMDGRDIGTVVLPDAEVKIFLTAAPKVRARRRYKELIEKGEQVDFDSVLAAIIRRDENDSSRTSAPLKQADDAVLVDSSALTLAETTNRIKQIIANRV